MNRRRFIQSLAAMFTLPAGASIALQPTAVALPSVAVVPAKARFWAIYMSSLHGECTPQTLHNLLHIPKVDANNYISQLITDGVIKPNPLLQKTVSQVLKAKDESLFDNIKKRSEMKAQSKSGELEVHKALDKTQSLETEAEFVDNICEDNLEIAIEDQEAEDQLLENEVIPDEILVDEAIESDKVIPHKARS